MCFSFRYKSYHGEAENLGVGEVVRRQEIASSHGRRGDGGGENIFFESVNGNGLVSFWGDAAGLSPVAGVQQGVRFEMTAQGLGASPLSAADNGQLWKIPASLQQSTAARMPARKNVQS